MRAIKKIDASTGAAPPSVAAVQARITEEVSRALGIPVERLDVTERFRTYGLDSAHATTILVRLQQWLGRPLRVTALWENPTIESLARHLAAGPVELARSSALSASLPPPEPRAGDEPIAVIGIGCRFPGGATSPEDYWRVLRDGIDTITTVPKDRWDVEKYYDADRSARGKMNTRWGGFLDRVDAFDAQFFGISPREAASMDPQQRLLLEVAWQALEDAGVIPEQLKGTAAGVFIGAMWNDYGRLQRADEVRIEQHTATGADTSIIAGRISYSLGLQGPSIAVNTACSSSLVAVHLACQSLRSGESSLAIAGGVSLMLSPWSTVAMTKFGAMSPDGRCRAFDARANGYVRGEGGGMVILKPLSRALADGDRIYCLVIGSAVNNDGFSNGLTAPNPKAQEEVLRKAYERAGISPSSVEYVETHGPGTLLGDPIEANALGAVLGAGRGEGEALRIGSVKTNLGHTEAAAGIAGLIKVALSMRNGLLPPSLHFETPNPHIAFDALGIEVQTQLGAWPERGGPHIAGVSSFGFGGTNCHAVLQAAPDSREHLFPIAADKNPALRTRFLELLSVVTTPKTDEELDEIARALGRSWHRGAHRVGLVARSSDELVQQLLKCLSVPGTEPHKATAEKPRIVWICPGQGSQWVGMGRSLLR
ncbi:MAG TPA: beta-ketoacyl synthase N-terminal-like domain-containing protein, partial [Polyangiaceae bacterium]